MLLYVIRSYSSTYRFTICQSLSVFQSKTYSYRIPSDENVLNTYGELSERAFNLGKRARNLTDVFPYVGVHWQTYGCVTAA